MRTPEEIERILKRPFKPAQLGWKAQAVSGDKTKALAVAFIDARDVQNRLDEAVGIAGWRTSFAAQADGVVLCRLELRIEGEWVGKEDVGGESEQSDVGDRHKAAVSDALKRAAVAWGVGRYLYYLPASWVPYDGKKITQTPELPHWAVPPKASDADAETHEVAADPRARAQATAEAARQERYGDRAAAQTPDWLRGLHAYDARLAEQRLCAAGDLVKHVAAAGKRGGFPADMTLWNETQVADARAEAKHFEHQRRTTNMQPA